MRSQLLRAVLLALPLTAVGPLPADAQVPATAVPDWRYNTSMGIGYVGNLPRALIGASAHVMSPALRGFGVMGEFRISHESFEGRESFEPGRTPQQARASGHEYVITVENWWVANLAVVRPITPELAIYVGGGLGRGNYYDEFIDPEGEFGQFGVYRVLDEFTSGRRLNVTGGALFRFGRNLAFQFGVESAPGGLTAGGSLVIPR